MVNHNETKYAFLNLVTSVNLRSYNIIGKTKSIKIIMKVLKKHAKIKKTL